MFLCLASRFRQVRGAGECESTARVASPSSERVHSGYERRITDTATRDAVRPQVEVKIYRWY